MADKRLKIDYDLDFRSRGVANINRQLAKTGRLVGKSGRGGSGVAGGLFTAGLLVDSIATNFRRAAVAAVAFGGAVGVSLHNLNKMEQSQRRIITLFDNSPAVRSMFFGNKNFQAGNINRGLYAGLNRAGVRRETLVGPLNQMAIYGLDPIKQGLFKNRKEMIRSLAAMNAAFGQERVQLAFKGLGQGLTQDPLQAQEYYQMAEAGFATLLNKHGVTRELATNQGVTKEILLNAWREIFKEMKDSPLAEQQARSIDSIFARLNNTYELGSYTLGRAVNKDGRLVSAVENLTSKVNDWLLVVDEKIEKQGAGSALGKALGMGGAFTVGSGLAIGAAGKAAIAQALLFAAIGGKEFTLGRMLSGGVGNFARYSIAGIAGAALGTGVGQAVGGDDGALYGGAIGGLAGVGAMSLGGALVGRMLNRKSALYGPGFTSGSATNSKNAARFLLHRSLPALSGAFGTLATAATGLAAAFAPVTLALGVLAGFFAYFKVLEGNENHANPSIGEDFIGGDVNDLGFTSSSRAQLVKVVVELGNKAKAAKIKAAAFQSDFAGDSDFVHAAG